MTSVPRFYMYTSEALDHQWLRSCTGFDELFQSSQRENLGEVHFRAQLATHPARVLDPEQATAFFVPVFEYASYSLGECNGTSHRLRMVKARDELTLSEYWKRRRGVDHFFVSTAWSQSSRNPPLLTMWSRMVPLSEVLRCSMAGRYKTREDHLTPMSAVASCVLEVPYPVVQPTTRDGDGDQALGAMQYAPADGAIEVFSRRSVSSRNSSHGITDWLSGDGGWRPLFLHFAGSFDVCCHGRAIRCAIGTLMVRSAHSDLFSFPLT